jgi:hypothetical protein
LEFIRKRIKKYYNIKRIKRLTFLKGDIVYLATKNITIKQPSYKLDYKYIRLYKVKRKILENNYKLDLLLKVRLYLIFYIALLKSAANTIYIKTGNKPEEIKRLEVYKAEAIRDIRRINKQIEYLIK